MNFTIKELNELIYSLGITASKGIMCDKDLNVSLLNKLYGELNSRVDEENEDENDWLENRLSEDSFPHYVTNEEADEDTFRTWNEAPYGNDDEDEEVKEPKKFGEGTAQFLLDYVDKKGAVSHKELHEYYKSLNGSNTFSWCLRNLRIPYKNRKTQRYLAKEGRGGSTAKWVVKVANPSNWIVKEY